MLGSEYSLGKLLKSCRDFGIIIKRSLLVILAADRKSASDKHIGALA